MLVFFALKSITDNFDSIDIGNVYVSSYTVVLNGRVFSDECVEL